jgi:hypothetical protein
MATVIRFQTKAQVEALLLQLEAEVHLRAMVRHLLAALEVVRREEGVEADPLTPVEVEAMGKEVMAVVLPIIAKQVERDRQTTATQVEMETGKDN